MKDAELKQTMAAPRFSPIVQNMDVCRTCFANIEPAFDEECIEEMAAVNAQGRSYLLGAPFCPYCGTYSKPKVYLVN